MAHTKRPCANCPFRADGQGIDLRPGRIEGIIDGLLRNDKATFVCHKTLDAERQTCAGAVGVLHKLGRLPVITRTALAVGMLAPSDIEASARMVIDPATLKLQNRSRD